MSRSKKTSVSICSKKRKKFVTIPEEEYFSLKASAELLQEVDIYRFTLEGLRSRDSVPLEKALSD